MNKLECNTESEANTSALLNSLMYLNVEWMRIKNKDKLNEIVNKLSRVYDSPTGYYTYNMKCEKPSESDYEIRQNQFNQIKNMVANDENFANIEIGDQSLLMKNPSYQKGGLNAATFKDTEEKIYVVYRGTGAGEWIDNGKGVTGQEISTKQQIEAMKYFDRVVEYNNYNDSKPEIIVTGHSKGGNKSQYTTINSQYNELIKRCYSLNGQGMSPEAIKAFNEKSSENYDKSTLKIYGFHHENDYVNPLGVCIIPDDNKFYFKTSEEVKVHPLSGIIRYHYSDLYLKDSGKFTDQTEVGYISKLVESVSNSIMKMPPNMRAPSVNTAMGFLQKFAGHGVPVNEDKVSLHNYLIGIPEMVGIIGSKTLLTPTGLNAMLNISKELITKEIYPKLAESVVKTYIDIKIYVDKSIHALKENIAAISKKAYENFVNATKTIKDKIKEFGNTLSQKARHLYGQFVNALNNITDWVKNTTNKILETIKSKTIDPNKAKSNLFCNKLEYTKVIESYNQISSKQVRDEISRLKNDLKNMDNKNTEPDGQMDYLDKKIDSLESKFDLSFKKELGITNNKKIDFKKDNNLENQIDEKYNKIANLINLDRSKVTKNIIELDSIKKLPTNKSFEKLTEKFNECLKDKANNINEMNRIKQVMNYKLNENSKFINNIKNHTQIVHNTKEVAYNYDNKKLFKKEYQKENQHIKNSYNTSISKLSKYNIKSQKQISKLEDNHKKLKNICKKADHNSKLSREERETQNNPNKIDKNLKNKGFER